MAQDLESLFRELGLAQYLGAFIDQGFDTWDTILDIQESDLDALGVKLGHRRKLQRRIANARGIAPSVSLPSTIETNVEVVKGNAARPEKGCVEPSSEVTGTTKRKYRRHPKPDENAPERPPSAYVLFSNKMRDDLKSHNLTFTEIAKLVGENWQSLSPPEKEAYEGQANRAKERYHLDLSEYKKTPNYRKYTLYLQEFKEKQARQTQDHKRKKLDQTRLRRGSTSSSATPGSGGGSGSGSGMGSGNGSGNGSMMGSRSGSEKVHGSEPPPSRQERMDFTDSAVEAGFGGTSHHAHHFPIDESRISPRKGQFETCRTRDGTLHTQSLWTGSGGNRGGETGQQTLPSLSHVLDDGRPHPMAISSPPEAAHGATGFPGANPPLLVGVGPPVNTTSRVPSLIHETSSSGASSDSVSPVSSGGPFNNFRRPPGDGPLPIHALLSTNTVDGRVPLREQIPSPLMARMHTPSPIDQMQSPVTMTTHGPVGYGFQSAPSVLQHLKAEQSDNGDVVMTCPGTGPGIAQGQVKAGLDGMSALLRAGEIVDGRNDSATN